MKYKIVLRTMYENKIVIVDTKLKKIIRDGELIDCDFNFVLDSLNKIIDDWQNTKKTSLSFDEVKVLLDIENDKGEIKHYDFNGDFPKNINEFFMLLDKIYKCKITIS